MSSDPYQGTIPIILLTHDRPLCAEWRERERDRPLVRGERGGQGVADESRDNSGHESMRCVAELGFQCSPFNLVSWKCFSSFHEAAFIGVPDLS